MSHHRCIRVGQHDYLEGGMACSVTQDEDIDIGWVLTSSKPDVRRFKHPVDKKLHRQHVNITDIAAKTPENVAKIEAFKDLVNSTVDVDELSSHVQKVEKDRMADCDISGGQYGKVKASVKSDSYFEIDFGRTFYRLAKRKPFHDILNGLEIDFGEWTPLHGRTPTSLYIVWRVDSSEKVVCREKVSTEVHGHGGVSKLPGGVHAETGADSDTTVELLYEKMKKGPIGFKCAQFHCDPVTKRLRMVEFDYTARSNWRVNRYETDAGRQAGQEQESQDYGDSLRAVSRHDEVKDALKIWSTNQPDEDAVEFVEALALKILSTSDIDVKAFIVPASWLSDGISIGCLTAEVAKLLGSIGITLTLATGQEPVLSWSYSDKMESILLILPALVRLAQDNQLYICEVDQDAVDTCRTLLCKAADVAPKSDQPASLQFPLPKNCVIDGKTMSILENIGIQITGTEAQYNPRYLRPHCFHMMAAFAGAFSK